MYSCHVLVRRLARLQVWLWPIIVHVPACHLGGGSRNCQSWRQRDHQGKRRRSQARWETLTCEIFFVCGSHGIPNTTSPIFDYVKHIYADDSNENSSGYGKVFCKRSRRGRPWRYSCNFSDIITSRKRCLRFAVSGSHDIEQTMAREWVSKASRTSTVQRNLTGLLC